MSDGTEKGKIDVSIIIPCYNEEEGIPNLIVQLDPVLKELGKGMAVEVIFVDDGSSDRTFELLDVLCRGRDDFSLARHEKNMGIGAALKTGFGRSRGDIIVATDSDCTYPPGEIPRIISFLEPGVDIVTASPYHPDGGVENVPGYRLFLSKGVARIYRSKLDSDLHTFTAMFRAYRRHVVNDVKFESDDFIAMVEILVRAMAKGYKIREMPTVLHSRIYGSSKMRTARVIKKHLRFILSIKGHGG